MQQSRPGKEWPSQKTYNGWAPGPGSPKSWHSRVAWIERAQLKRWGTMSSTLSSQRDFPRFVLPQGPRKGLCAWFLRETGHLWDILMITRRWKVWGWGLSSEREGTQPTHPTAEKASLLHLNVSGGMQCPGSGVSTSACLNLGWQCLCLTTCTRSRWSDPKIWAVPSAGPRKQSRSTAPCSDAKLREHMPLAPHPPLATNSFPYLLQSPITLFQAHYETCW